MQKENRQDVSGWFRRYLDQERSPQQLAGWAETTDAYCAAASVCAADIPLESEASQFTALLHELAPDALKP